ncbi:SDR family NAD(P)-dependent oxidoreductase [Catenisphaera adipataccumulans]|uniref:NAD(P)-dependent dehydrogenase (Short-subunit alcohol dehydrogenase family) n=1 Tax=Catenisphaera adipataccumulans TaxID=700500 RepID=A0A7W8CW17_9FIRM|nr:SDR family oxidoreductase [Catenisphaera adipataccumulans]MBB5182661.1 NAD(P)-dependent dehydrogenase (short-subunit alcohol dehydrogenase family) [Catenisphaera adipataccumulans]
MKTMENKVALVTGGGKGIGLGIAKAFAEQGADVVIAGRHEDVLKKACEENEHFYYVKADITKSDDISRIVQYIKEKFQRLDILVNNAGWCPVKPITEITMKDYDAAFDLDVRALVDMTIQSLDLLKASKGNIINMSSVGGQNPGPNLSMYVGAKAAVENFTKAWAVELAPYGIRVNAIAPGAIETDIWKVPGLTEEESRKHLAESAARIPMKRMGQPEEIGRGAVFLADDKNSYITGTILTIDGGISIG